MNASRTTTKGAIPINTKPAMHRKPFLTLFIALVPLMIALTGNAAATYYSRASGDWNVNTTWSTTSGGDALGAGIYPVTGDTVIIERSFTVTVTARSEEHTSELQSLRHLV